MPQPAKTAFEEFLRTIQAQESEARRRAHLAEQERDRKSELLIPVRQFLLELVKIGVVVTHSSKYEGRASEPPVPLEPYENESSPRWSPGISIFLDHPAAIEISIPNHEAEGVVQIHVSSKHPRTELLRGPFDSMEEACRALSRFLALDTTRVERPPFELDDVTKMS